MLLSYRLKRFYKIQGQFKRGLLQSYPNRLKRRYRFQQEVFQYQFCPIITFFTKFYQLFNLRGKFTLLNSQLQTHRVLHARKSRLSCGCVCMSVCECEHPSIDPNSSCPSCRYSHQTVKSLSTQFEGPSFVLRDVLFNPPPYINKSIRCSLVFT